MTSYTFVTLNDPSAPSYTAGAGINAFGRSSDPDIDGSGDEYGFLYRGALPATRRSDDQRPSCSPGTSLRMAANFAKLPELMRRPTPSK